MSKSSVSGRGLARLVAPVVYAAGLAALTLCDVVVSSLFDVNDVALWSRVRAISGILAIVCLLGLDQFLIRTPESAPLVKRMLALQIPLVSVVAAMIASITGFVQSWLLVAFVAIFSSVSIAMSQFYRARSLLVLAQLCQQSWKFIFIIGIILFIIGKGVIGFDDILLISSIVSLCAICVIYYFGLRIKRYNVPADYTAINLSVFGTYSVSFRLMAISCLTALSLYLEQIAVNVFGSKHEAATYFTHTTYFLFSSSFINGYLAFLAGPWARNNHDKFISIMNKWWVHASVIIAVYVGLIQGLAYVGWGIIGPVVGEVDGILLILFSVSAISRTFYTYPGAYFSAFGGKGHYTEIAMFYTISLCAGVAVFCLLRWSVGVPVIYAVGFASAFNWALRSAMGMRYVSVISASVRGVT